MQRKLNISDDPEQLLSNRTTPIRRVYYGVLGTRYFGMFSANSGSSPYSSWHLTLAEWSITMVEPMESGEMAHLKDLIDNLQCRLHDQFQQNLILLESHLAFTPIDKDLKGLRDDLVALKGEVTDLKGEITDLRDEVKGLREKVEGKREFHLTSLVIPPKTRP